jgi:hypothetical protein
MPTNAWSAKRKRQFVHIKDSLQSSGKPEPLAEEIAARVVNKERAQHGETQPVQASATAANDTQADRHVGLPMYPADGSRTLLQLRNEARQRGVKGRSMMSKAQLEAALAP